MENFFREEITNFKSSSLKKEKKKKNWNEFQTFPNKQIFLNQIDLKKTNISLLKKRQFILYYSLTRG